MEDLVTDHSPKTALVVDYNDGCRRYHAALLRMLGYEVTVADSCSAAMPHIGTDHTVYILDRRMGEGGDGLTLIPVILDRCPAAQIVMISADTDLMDRPEFADTRVQLWPKPVDPDRFDSLAI